MYETNLIPTCYTGFQTWIGYNDVKSLPVYFYVQRNGYFNMTNTPIPFQMEKLNIGNAMDLASGKFTAPRTGVYAFSFTGLAYIPASSSRLNIEVGMYLNGNIIGSEFADELNTAEQWETFSFQWTLSLKKGDQIWLQIFSKSAGTYLWDSSWHYNHFSGFLLAENILQSLNIL